MQILEIGGGGFSSDGSEPSVEAVKGHLDCGAGYEFWLARPVCPPERPGDQLRRRLERAFPGHPGPAGLVREPAATLCPLVTVVVS
jgi:hypothetical protein